MPQRQMDKAESKYDLLQWMKVTIAIGRLKKEIADKAGDLRALEEQQKAIDEELDKSRTLRELNCSLSLQVER